MASPTHAARKLRKVVFQARTFMGPYTMRTHRQLGRALRRRLLARPRPPISVVLGITRACQCRCVHCFVDNDPKVPAMDTAQLRGVLDQLARWGVLKVVFFGGEPTLRADLFPLMEHASGLGLRVGLNTNGLLVDRAFAARAAALRISNVQLSLDSPDPARHDALRGHPGSFDRALAALAALRERRIPVMISTYATRQGVRSGDLARLVALARERDATGVTILPTVLAGGFREAEQRRLEPSDLRAIFALADPTFVFLEDTWDEERPAGRRCMCARKDVLYVSPEGEVQACPSIPISFGNVLQDPLERIAAWMWRDPLFSQPNGSCDGCIVNDPTFRSQRLDPMGDALLERRYQGRPVDWLGRS
jgi:MoaA/NifB/PqqE/SkfB family radical SAM enzyme